VLVVRHHGADCVPADLPAEILKGFLERDYKRVSEVHFEAGYVPANHSMDDFAQALRSVGEPIFGKDATEVSMARVLLQLFDITRQFGMHLRPELILLQKTMVQVEGVARSIDPAHNIWQAAKPVVDRWTRREFGPEGLKKLAVASAREAMARLRRLAETLQKLDEALNRAAKPPLGGGETHDGVGLGAGRLRLRQRPAAGVVCADLKPSGPVSCHLIIDPRRQSLS
jgi:predicted unusual protein kinase regulating ubiquinone biosynthesis (AarF/ABC1/UbiB family)